jgi:hypothetical protein
MSAWHRRAHLEAVQQAQPAADSFPELNPNHVKALRDSGYSDDYISKLPIGMVRNHYAVTRATSQEPAQSIDPRLIDHAKRILMPSLLDQDTKATAWDHYFAAKTPTELSARLQTLNLPTDVHQQLVDAKQATMPVLTPVDKAVEAVKKLASMDPRTLDLAENHNHVFQAFLAGSAD